MENRFEHTSQEEKQGWGAYVPHTPPGTWSQPSGAQPTLSLCARVREMLPKLVDDDSDLHPDMATALRGHLSVCPACAIAFEQMRRALTRVVSLVESLGQAEMPMDFSAPIMQQILGDRKASATPPFTAAPSVSYAHVSANQEAETPPLAVTVEVFRQERAEETISLTASGAYLWERLLLSTLLAAALAFFLMTDTGRSALGVNVNVVQDWLGQIGAVLTHIPVLGVLFAALFTALARIGDIFADAYRALGQNWGRGLILDAALFGAAYYFLVVRKSVRLTIHI